MAYSVGLISRFMQKLSKIHLGSVKRVIDLGIWYGSGDNNSGVVLHGYTDSDLANNLDDRKSISTNMFTLGSGSITWSPKKQHVMLCPLRKLNMFHICMLLAKLCV